MQQPQEFSSQRVRKIIYAGGDLRLLSSISVLQSTHHGPFLPCSSVTSLKTGEQCRPTPTPHGGTWVRQGKLTAGQRPREPGHASIPELGGFRKVSFLLGAFVYVCVNWENWLNDTEACPSHSNILWDYAFHCLPLPPNQTKYHVPEEMRTKERSISSSVVIKSISPDRRKRQGATQTDTD